MNYRRTLIAALGSLLSLIAITASATPEADFWRWFRQNEPMLFDFERDQERTFDRLAEQLHKIHPSLTFEFGPKQDGRREFVISADGHRQAFSSVESLFAVAPQLARWKVVKFRPRRAPFDIEYGRVSVKADSVSVILRPEGSKVGLTVLLPGYTGTEHRSYIGVAFLLLDQALGEFDVETRVGTIEVRAPVNPESTAVPLSRLPQAFDAQFPSR